MSGLEFMNDEDSSVHENVDVTETSTPPASSVDDRDTYDELESEDAPVDVSTTIAQQVQMHLIGRKKRTEQQACCNEHGDRVDSQCTK
jgi:hypothetical protein